MTNKISVLILTFLVLWICAVPVSSGDSQNQITVSAAMSLKNAFAEIGKLHQAKSDMKILFNFGASGDLIRQIAGGAPVDIFASAAEKDMDDLERQGGVHPGSRKIFARNSIVLVVPGNSGVTLRTFPGLLSEKITRIAICNPRTSPAGRYAEEVLRYYQLSDGVRGKLILAENVRQVLDYVARGEVDAGIVYSTDAMARSREVAVVAAAPAESHSAVVYPIAIIKGTENIVSAQAFISLVTSPDGRKILEKHGFRTNIR
jgi:molybdate transport system substrate-binding protein